MVVNYTLFITTGMPFCSCANITFSFYNVTAITTWTVQLVNNIGFHQFEYLIFHVSVKTELLSRLYNLNLTSLVKWSFNFVFNDFKSWSPLSPKYGIFILTVSKSLLVVFFILFIFRSLSLLLIMAYPIVRKSTLCN